jgi:hypothetical protein
MKTVESGPDLGIAEPILLQHFLNGLEPESTVFLDSSSGGSFAHLYEFPNEEEEPMPTTPSEPKPIEEKLAFPTIQSVKDFTPLTKTWFTDEPFQPYQEVYDPRVISSTSCTMRFLSTLEILGITEE